MLFFLGILMAMGHQKKSGTESIVKYTFITPGNVSPEVTVSAEDTDVFLRESLTVAPVPENSSGKFFGSCCRLLLGY